MDGEEDVCLAEGSTNDIMPAPIDFEEYLRLVMANEEPSMPVDMMMTMEAEMNPCPEGEFRWINHTPATMAAALEIKSQEQKKKKIDPCKTTPLTTSFQDVHEQHRKLSLSLRSDMKQIFFPESIAKPVILNPPNSTTVLSLLKTSYILTLGIPIYMSMYSKSNILFITECGIAFLLSFAKGLFVIPELSPLLALSSGPRWTEAIGMYSFKIYNESGCYYHRGLKQRIVFVATKQKGDDIIVEQHYKIFVKPQNSSIDQCVYGMTVFSDKPRKNWLACSQIGDSFLLQFIAGHYVKNPLDEQFKTIYNYEEILPRKFDDCMSDFESKRNKRLKSSGDHSSKNTVLPKECIYPVLESLKEYRNNQFVDLAWNGLDTDYLLCKKDQAVILSNDLITYTASPANDIPSVLIGTKTADDSFPIYTSTVRQGICPLMGIFGGVSIFHTKFTFDSNQRRAVSCIKKGISRYTKKIQ